jgi:hypothetical protein
MSKRPSGARTIHCANRDTCNNILEVRKAVRVPSALTAAGWIYRGSQQGLLYFCHCCAPVVLKKEKEWT